MRFLRPFLILLLLVSAPAAARPGDAGWLYRGSDIEADPAWRFGTLANGIRYAVRRNALPPGQVSIRLRIAVGGLHEEDHEQGWAHLVEHMLFRGTASFADREARHIWQRLGASFGSDTNATTGLAQTVYQLDLPQANREALDTSLHVLAEMMGSALFDPAALDAERRIVLAEKGRRPELSVRIAEVSRPLFYAGLRAAERDIIGTDETLRGATAEGLRAFYRRWYRPDRATLVMVGDMDPAIMEELIARRFAGWEPAGPPPADPDHGSPAPVAERVATIAYEGAPHSASLMWLRPYEERPHTVEREREALERSLAARIVNRRLEARARAADAPFTHAGVSGGRSPNVAETASLSVTPREGRWREALAEAVAILSDALAAPPSEAEIARELSNMRINVEAAVQGEATVRSQQRAQQLINAIEGRSVVATAAATLALFERNAPEMSPERVGAALRALVSGEGPRMLLLAPDPVPAAEAAAALAAAEAAAPAVRAAERDVSLDDLPPLGAPGEEIAREAIGDLGVSIVRFANGSTLTHKQTDFDQGSVFVQLRFGPGLAGLAPDRPSLAWTAGAIGPSGLADLDLDALERLLTGRRIAMSFAVGEDAFVLRGQTNRGDLADQLRLLAGKLAFPRWDESVFGRFQASALQAYELAFASASARFGREFPGFARPKDERWRPVTREEIGRATAADWRAFFEPLLAAGPLHAVIVGDVDLDAAVAAMRGTVAALPPRPEWKAPAAARAVRPPEPADAPATFTHQGDPDQAYALIGWTTLGGADRIADRRALSLAGNILSVRLFDRLREEEGATYSPAAAHSSSEIFPDWGIFYAAAEIRPESADTFFRIAREEVRKLAAEPVLADEFERAINPIVTGIERRLVTNAYWMTAIESFAERPETIANVRSFLADYRGMTPEHVRAAIAAHVAEGGDWSMLVLPARDRDGAR